MKTGVSLIIAIALCSLVANEKTSAQNVTATILNGGNSGITLPFGGGTFTFDINIMTSFASLGISYFLQSNDGSGFFSLTGRDITGSPFQSGIPPFPILLDPVSGGDLGGGVVNINNPAPPGTIFIATYFLFYSAALAPGVYHISLDNRTIVVDTNFSDHFATGNEFTVTIVPEPAPVSLAVLGGMMLLAIVWKTRRLVSDTSRQT